MSSDYEIDDEVSCCECGHSPLHYRDCINWCEDGYIEEFLDDLEIEGTGYETKCSECKGTGVEWWCPNCGENLSGKGQDKNKILEDIRTILNVTPIFKKEKL